MILREGEQRERTAERLINLFMNFEDGTTTEDIIPLLIAHEKAMKTIESEPRLFADEAPK